MDEISSRCARAAHALCCALMASTGSGCMDASPGEDAGVGELSAMPPQGAPPPADASTGMAMPAVAAPDDSAPAADAAVAAPVATQPLDSVDANGVRGVLADLPFLADMGEGKKEKRT